MFHTGFLYIEELSPLYVLGEIIVFSKSHDKDLTKVSVCCITSHHCGFYKTGCLGFFLYL